MMRRFALLNLLLEHKSKYAFLLFWVFFFNLISACSEGISFSCLFLALASLSQEQSLPPLLTSLMDFVGFQVSFVEWILFAIGLQAVRTLSLFCAFYSSARLTVAYQQSVQMEVFRKILSFSFPYVNHYKSGTLADFINMPTNCLRPILDALTQVVISCFVGIALLLFMLCVSWQLTLSALFLFLSVGLLYRFAMRKIKERSKLYSQALSDMAADMIDGIHGIRLIHYFHNASRILQRFQLKLKQVFHSYQKLVVMGHLFSTSFECISVALVAALLLIGKYFFSDGNLLAPSLLAFIAACHRLATRIHPAVAAIGTFAYNLGPILRLNEFLQDHDKEFIPLTGKREFCLQKAIELKKVSLQYPGKEALSLNELSLHIPIGQTIAFVGSSGSGKSSLFDLLLRLYAPTSGHILIDGEDLTHLQLQSWREKIGIVNQDIFLFHDTVFENLRFGKEDATEQEIIRAATLAGADCFIRSLPNGYQTVIGERGTRVSGGERQRLAIARALVRSPQILLLDEATSSLDSEIEKAVQDCIHSLRHRMTVLIAAHRLSTIMNADWIYVLEQGMLIEQGTHDDLLNKQGKYAKLWGFQMSFSPE